VKDIFFAGHRVLTSDEIADAVIQYAAALVSAAGADVVTFPAFNDGEPVECSLLIGCGAQIAVMTAPAAYPGHPGGRGRSLCRDRHAARGARRGELTERSLSRLR
jgi:hypothetical protein